MTAGKWLRSSTEETLLNTGASLTNNSLAVSSAIAITDTGYLVTDVALVATWGTAPSANTGVSVWFLRETDGTNYEDGDASTTPSRPPDVVFPARAVNTAQRVVRQAVLPPGNFKALAKNDGTGQTINSGWTLKAKPATFQQV